MIAAVTFTFVNQLQQCNSHLDGNVAIKELLLSFTQKAGQSYSWDSFCAVPNCPSEVADNNTVITDGITETIANNHKTPSLIMGEYNLLNILSNI